MTNTIYIAYGFGFVMGFGAAGLIKIAFGLITARQVKKNTIHTIQNCSKVKIDQDFFNRLEKIRKGRSK